MQIEAAEITGLAIPIGGIIGIILAILFIILLCALLAFFLLRRKKKDYKDNSQQVEIKETAKLNDYVVGEEITTVTTIHKEEAKPLLKSAPLKPLMVVDGNTSTSNSKDKDQDININIINIIKKKDESKESQIPLIKEEVIIRPKEPKSSSSSSPSFSDTSSSSTSFYDAEYVGPRVVQQVK